MHFICVDLITLKLFRVGRMILTKRPGADDDVSDADAEDITSLYKNPDGMSRYQNKSDFNYHFSNTLEFICVS